MTQPLNRMRQNEKNRHKNHPCKRSLSLVTSPTLADSLTLDTCTPGVPIFYLGETSFQSVKALNGLNIFIRAIWKDIWSISHFFVENLLNYTTDSIFQI